MEVWMMLGALFLLLGPRGSIGYPSGAPQSACASMTPGHGSEQITANPYRIAIVGGLSSYTPGHPVRVRIMGDADFRGTMVQVRRVSGVDTTTPVGRFADPTASSGGTLRLLECSNAGDAITHTSAFTQTVSPGVELTWHPPSEDVGEVYFVATFAQEQFTWWKNAVSRNLVFSDVMPIIHKMPGCSARCGKCLDQC